MDSAYMIYDESYHQMKNKGESVKDIDTAIRRYLSLFNQKSYTDILLCYRKQNIDVWLPRVCKKFEELYGEPMNSVELINRYQNGICISACTNLTHQAIYVDELFESVLMSFLLNSFLWSECSNEIEIWKMCFQNTLNCFHEQCILGRWSSDREIDKLIKVVIEKDTHLFDLAADCYWTIISFILAHELAHIYYKKIRRERGIEEKEWKIKECKQEEYDADRLAYNLVLAMIKEDCMLPENKRVLYEHSVLAPMMLMDFFECFYYTDKILYNHILFGSDHPEPCRRKRQLFGILYKEDYEIALEDAYALYQNFLDILYKEYKENLLLVF